MKKESFILKGDICYSENQTTLNLIENGYAVCIGGVSMGVFSDMEEIPEVYRDLPVKDYSGKLIVPGMVDIHLHAPQYAFRGMGMDLELLDWLNTYTFPEEEKYSDLEYAEKAYRVFTRDLKNSATTRAVIFGTIHRDATVLLMDMLEETGLECYVGKVNMDRNAPDTLREKNFDYSAYDTFGWMVSIDGRYENTHPILTPRFVVSCSDELLNELHEVQMTYHLPVQSHLSENPGEVETVRELCPDIKNYAEGYDRYGLFGGNTKTIMAHCVYCTPEEIDMLKKRGVYVAHCASSNMNLSSGIAPIRQYMDMGIRVGIGTDVAAGESVSMFRAIADTIQVSKLYWRYIDQSRKPLTFEESFYLATLGGGDFFGKVGSFAAGYEFDAVVLDDSDMSVRQSISLRNRLERATYLEADDDYIVDKYCAGRQINLTGPTKL